VAPGRLLGAACGWQRNTSGVERLHLPMRQPGAAIGRRGAPLGQGAEGLAQPRAWYHGSDHVCRPHGRVRQPRPQPVPTHRQSSAKPWRAG